MSRVPVHLLRGADGVLLSQALSTLLTDLVDGGDRSLLIEELAGDDYPIGAVVEAAQTSPFLTDFRIVVARDFERFTKTADVAPLVDYLADPLPSTILVLTWAGGRVPKTLLDAIAAAGGADRDVTPGRKTDVWVDEQLSASKLRFNRAARQRLVDWLGENVNRLPGLLATVETALGPGTTVGAEELEPFLGDAAGGVPPWDLTDAIDRGDIPGSLDALHRMLDGGGRHPLAILATLHTHVARLLALDGAEIRNEKEAAELLGMKGSPFPAKKALAQARRLGHERVVDAIDLVAIADLDLRGRLDWPDELALEVLVARLARLAR